MGLADLDPDSSTSTSSSSAGGGAASGGATSDSRAAMGSSGDSKYRDRDRPVSRVSPDEFPVQLHKTPYLVIFDTQEGLEPVFYPETEKRTVTFTDYGKYEYDLFEDEAKVIWTEDRYDLYEWRSEPSRVDLTRDPDGEDYDTLRRLLKDHTRAGLREMRRVEDQDVDQGVSQTERCGVCNQTLHVRYDSYEVVGGRRVCPDHTVEDLGHAGLV